MVDRSARDKLAEALRSYMSERITAFPFAQALEKIATDDVVVREIRFALYFCYDDFIDHKVHAAKDQWDYFNRILLLLASDAVIENVKLRRKWSFLQLIAAASVAFLLYALIVTGISVVSIGAFAACALVSHCMALPWWRNVNDSDSATKRISPFPSFGSLIAVRRRVPDFIREKYREDLGERTLRSPAANRLSWFNGLLLWSIFSPIILVFQAVPRRETIPRISLPGI